MFIYEHVRNTIKIIKTNVQIKYVDNHSKKVMIFYRIVVIMWCVNFTGVCVCVSVRVRV